MLAEGALLVALLKLAGVTETDKPAAGLPSDIQSTGQDAVLPGRDTGAHLAGELDAARSLNRCSRDGDDAMEITSAFDVRCSKNTSARQPAHRDVIATRETSRW
jgi:hypothetical protein